MRIIRIANNKTVLVLKNLLLFVDIIFNVCFHKQKNFKIN